MSGYTALLDANILYPAPMRDLFLFALKLLTKIENKSSVFNLGEG